MKKKLTKEKREKKTRIPVINTIYIDVAKHTDRSLGRKESNERETERGRDTIVLFIIDPSSLLF